MNTSTTLGYILFCQVVCPDFASTGLDPIPSVGLCVLTSSVLVVSFSVSWAMCPDFAGTGLIPLRQLGCMS